MYAHNKLLWGKNVLENYLWKSVFYITQHKREDTYIGRPIIKNISIFTYFFLFVSCLWEFSKL